jgi:tRNA threonylcarbamoyl adenosine modification protein YjeE
MFVENVESLRKLAVEFSKTLKAPKCIALYGDLGTGKTEFARSIIQELRGKDTIVPSPTFTIVQDYNGISHFDLYRIKSFYELEEIGLNDAILKNITLIEWPEIAENLLPKDTIRIHLSVAGSGREIEIDNPLLSGH